MIARFSHYCFGLLQIELACLIANPDPQLTSWKQLIADIAPGRLCVVGDPKQSIYRFRRADIEIYAAAKAAFNGKQESLVTNFRSDANIINWTNQVFEQLIGVEATPGQPAYVALDAAHDAFTEVETFGGPVEGGKADELRQLESDAIAKRVSQALAEGWGVRDPENGELRVIQPSDIAVLIPSRVSMKPLEEAFDEAGISYRLKVRSLLFATEEIETVLNVLEAIDAPRSSIAVVAALRSTVFGIDDRELVEFFATGVRWDYTSKKFNEYASTATGNRVVQALLQLATWHEQRFNLTPAQLCQQIVDYGELFAEAIVRPRARDSWRRYRFLIENAREFRAIQGGGLTEYVRWAKMQRSEMASVVEPTATEIDADAVQVMTMHGSKGLEFPYVLVAGAPTGLRSRGGQTVIISELQGHTTLEVSKSKDVATLGFDALAAAEEVMHREERIRLQYVACTRARDYLSVSLYHKPRSAATKKNPESQAGSIGELMWEFLGESTEPINGFVVTKSVNAEPTLKSSEISEQEFINGFKSKIEALAESRVVRPSSLVNHEHSDGLEKPDELKGVSKIEFGTAVHRVLEIVDLYNPTSEVVEQAVEQTLSELGIGQQVASPLRAYVDSALSSPTLRQIADEKLPHLKEVQASGKLDGQLTEGIIDLLIENQGSYVALDYKTDSFSDPSQAEKLGQQYSPQLKAYAEMVAQASGSTVEALMLAISQDVVEEVLA